jgi:hypothetical protein
MADVPPIRSTPPEYSGEGAKIQNTRKHELSDQMSTSRVDASTVVKAVRALGFFAGGKSILTFLENTVLALGRLRGDFF